MSGITEADTHRRLCDHFDLPRVFDDDVMTAGFDDDGEESREYVMSSKVTRHAVQAILDHERTGQRLTKRELRRQVRAKACGAIGVIGMMIWAWRIASWVSFIWDAWRGDDE